MVIVYNVYRLGKKALNNSSFISSTELVAMSENKPVFWIYLGDNERENKEAVDLAGNLKPDCKIRQMPISTIPYFDERWDKNALPAMAGGQRPDSTKGGGLHCGLDRIRDAVRMHEKHQKSEGLR